MEKNEKSLSKTLAEVRSKMPKERVVAETSELFKVFGDVTRLRIIYALASAELCVCDISEVLGMTSSAISHQLRVLRQARIISSRREGKSVFYKLDDEHIYSIFFAASEHISERPED